jgi:outer membrane protein
MDLRSSAWLLAALCASCAFNSVSAEEPVPTQWRVGVGARAAWVPEFPGSDSGEMIALPVFDISHGRFLLNSDGLGFRLVHSEGLSVTASLAADLSRREESDDSRLAGIGDVDRTAVAVLKGAYRVDRWQIAVALLEDLANEGHGTSAELSLQRGVRLTPRLSLQSGVAARWIDDEHAATFFGVNAEQSERSGLPIHFVGDGIADIRVFLRASYALDRRWILSTGGTWARLQGDVRDSPIVADDTQLSLDAAVIYRF